MKRTLLIIVVLLTTIVSCSKKDSQLLSPGNLELASSKVELLGVVNDILQMTNETDKAREISKIDYYDSKNRILSIVSYLTVNGNKKTMGIEKTFDEMGNVASELGFSCHGSCNCQIGVVKNPDGTLYSAECTCSPCSMTVTGYNKANQKAQSEGSDVQSLANRSHVETVGVFENVRITDLRYADYEQAEIQTYTYADSKGISSTFMLLKPKKDFTTNGQTLLKEKSYVVDCTGSCDCRERFLPATNGIECTCSPCSMKITEVPATP